MTVIVLFPFAALLALELLLRAVGYGSDLDLFTSRVIGGKTYLQMNPEVGQRYFSRIAFHPATSPDLLSVPKPPGGIRIFCLGGSTTVGFPYAYNGAFSSYLRDRLRVAFPGRTIEVVNVGLTATNSFTTLDLARDCLRYEPDALIVYDGHNEFYGALGGASRESFGTSRWLTNLSLRLIRWKTGQLARDLVNLVRSLFGSQPGDLPGMMMERLGGGAKIPYGGAIYTETLGDFRENLHDLTSACASAGVPLILTTQVSNLRDLPPFVSGNPPGTTPAERLSFSTVMNDGIRFSLDGATDSALARFRIALALDTLRAETWFRIGQDLEQQRDYAGARVAYTKARDYDQLRFRASSDFNAAIREAAAGGGAYVLDAESLFAQNSPDSLIGNTLLFEHVHPRSRGTFLLAREYAGILRDHRLPGPRSDWQTASTVDERQLWNDRDLTGLDEIIARRRIEILTSGWPFQPYTREATKIPAGDTLAAIAEGYVRQRIGWVEAHDAAARFYLLRHDTVSAANEYETVLRELPYRTAGYVKLARLKAVAGNWDSAESLCTQSLVYGATSQSLRLLGEIAGSTGRPDEAARWFAQASGLDRNTIQTTRDRGERPESPGDEETPDPAMELVERILAAEVAETSSLPVLKERHGQR